MTDIVVDEILCYISNAMDTVPSEDLVGICCHAFELGEIRQSKLKFFTLCKRLKDDTNIPAGGIKFIPRRGESAVNDIKDIMKLFQELGTEIPVFAAVNLKVVPSLSNTDDNVTKLIVAVESLKAEVLSLKTGSEQQRKTMGEIQQKLDKPSYAGITGRGTGAGKRPPASNQIRKAGGPPPVQQSPVNSDGISNSVPSENIDNEGFITYRKPRKKRPFKKGQQAPTVQANENNSSKLVGIKQIKTAHVFVTRLPPDCESEEVQAHIRVNLNLEATVEKIRNPRSSNEYLSFHVSCVCDDPKVFFEPSLWPEHCLYRRWWPPRRPRDNDTTGNGASMQN